MKTFGIIFCFWFFAGNYNYMIKYNYNSAETEDIHKFVLCYYY